MRISNGTLLTLAAFSMTFALICENVTLARGDYRLVLAIALAFMISADICCAVVFARGG